MATLIISCSATVGELYVTDVSGQQIADYATQLATDGTKYPYVSPGRDTTKGFDCCGLVWYMYNHFGGIGDAAVGEGNQTSQIKHGIAVDYSKYKNSGDCSEFEPGDLIFFGWEQDGNSDHVAIYVGNNQVGNNQLVHSSYDKSDVVSVSAQGKWAYKWCCGVRRVIPRIHIHTVVLESVVVGKLVVLRM